MKSQVKILISFYFLLGLFILLLNDFYLKNQFHNDLTGKISDFAGLFIFPIFWTALFPKFKNVIFILTGILFVIWKSSLSQFFIDEWNYFMPFSIDRVVDYSDLIALSILPLSNYFISNCHSDYQIKMNPVFPLILSCFAFMATSQRQYVDINKVYTLDISKDTLQARLNRIDKLNDNEMVAFTCKTQDTIDIKLPFLYCEEFEVRITVSEININRTDIELIMATELCDVLRKLDYMKLEQEVIEIFEERIINKLK